MNAYLDIAEKYTAAKVQNAARENSFTPDAVDEFSSHFDKNGLEMQLFELENALINNLDSKSHIVQSLFREIHSLKGTSAFLNIDQLTHFMHKFEDVIGLLSNNIQRITAVRRTEIFDYFLQSFDLLEKLLMTYQKDSKFVLKDNESFFGFYIRLINEFRNIQENTDQYLVLSAIDEDRF